MRICLPNELLADIVEILFRQSAHSRVRAGSSTGTFETKPPWSCIRNVVLSSRTLRAIGLKLWFSRLRVRSEQNWEYISSIPGIYSWVREISYHNVTSLLIPSIHPKNFPALTSVSIRMLSVDRPLEVIGRLPQSVTYLEIWKFDTMIHDHLFAAIVARLPDLRELRLHGMGEVDKFGIGTLFTSAETLGWSIATSLSPIQTLRVLSIDVYLTPSTVLLRHASCPRGAALISCERCIREFADETHSNEIEVSFRIATALPSLEMIEWCSCFRPCRKRMLRISRDVGGIVSIRDSKEAMILRSTPRSDFTALSIL
ncbi:hypothetical protein JB92DRAFT_3098895 [Gautieria morchelliformis]|nr:hypothetical protein JB92DRAFT_3098895 [Gautieria morchelliformis]